MRFLITGISGFAGSHLAAHLLDSGHEVFGVARGADRDDARRLRAIRGRHRDRLGPQAIRACDLRDESRLRRIVREVRPDGVFHLAGIAFAPHAARDPAGAYQVNLLGSIALLDAVLAGAPKARVVFPSSGEVYGWVEPRELPITESQPLRPVSPYGVGKAAADLAAFQYFFSRGLDVVRVRPFNHTGPGQSPDFVCSELARAVAAAEAGAAEPVLRVGNLDVERDFTDVRDTVRGYLSLCDKGEAGEAYNLASGRSVRVRSILDRLRAASRVELRVETDPAKLRPKEIPRVEVSVRKVREATGWAADIPLERTLDDLLSWWRTELSG
ncbi:MAG: GDP-mannose 4,6-dehydratase [Candidatus Binatia bacterium]